MSLTRITERAAGSRARRRVSRATRLAPALFAAAALLLAAAPAAAQCAMCGLSAEQAGDPETVARTFNLAILVLLVPVIGLVGALAGVTWKMRNWDGAILEPDEVPSRPSPED